MVSSSTNKLGHQIICCGWNKSCSVCAIEYYFVEGVYYMLFNLYRKEPFEETVWKKRIYVAGTRTDYINADSIHCRFEDLSKNIQMHCMQLCFLSKIQTCCQSERWHLKWIFLDKFIPSPTILRVNDNLHWCKIIRPLFIHCVHPERSKIRKMENGYH